MPFGTDVFGTMGLKGPASQRQQIGQDRLTRMKALGATFTPQEEQAILHEPGMADQLFMYVQMGALTPDQRAKAEPTFGQFAKDAGMLAAGGVALGGLTAAGNAAAAAAEGGADAAGLGAAGAGLGEGAQIGDAGLTGDPLTGADAATGAGSVAQGANGLGGLVTGGGLGSLGTPAHASGGGLNLGPLGKIGFGQLAQGALAGLDTIGGAAKFGKEGQLESQLLAQTQAQQKDRDALRSRLMASPTLGNIPQRPDLGSLFAGSQNPFARGMGPLQGAPRPRQPLPMAS